MSSNVHPMFSQILGKLFEEIPVTVASATSIQFFKETPEEMAERDYEEWLTKTAREFWEKD